MIKRIMATFTSVLIYMAMLTAIPVSAEVTLPANVATDYIADESTKFNNNMVASGTTGLVGPAWGGDFSYGFNGKGTLVYSAVTATHAYIRPIADITTGFGGGTDPVAGYIIKTTRPTGLSGRVLWSFSFKADQEGLAMLVNVGRRNESAASGTAAYVEYPIEYNGSNKGVVPTTGYRTYTGTFADTGAPSEKYAYEIGFVEGTVAQAATRIDTTQSYIGYEYAYDMTIVADATTVVPGSTFGVSAAVINQIGNAFGGDDGITWYATTSDRSAAVDGFTFTDNEDGTYDVSVASSVDEGTYTIVAVSDTNENIVKGVSIVVGNSDDSDEVGNLDYSDYIPGEVTGNILADKIPFSYNYHHINMILPGETSKTSDVNFIEATDYYSIKANRDIPDPLAQFTVDSSTGAATWDGVSFAYPYAYAGGFVGINSWGSVAGEKGNVVFSFKVNSGVTSDGVAHTPVVSIGRTNRALGNSNPERVEYPVEYQERTSGVTPVSTGTTEWSSTLSGTFLNNNVAVDGYDYMIGLAQGTNNGETVYVSRYDAYMGLEYAYDIAIEADKTAFEGKGSQINIDYGIVNQVYQKGGIDQTVELLVTNTERNMVLTNTGIEITDNGDGTAVATYDPFITTPGVYDIVVYSEKYEMAKGITITVPEVEMVANVDISEFDGNEVTATFKLLNNTETEINALMVVVMVNDFNKILNIATQRITGVNVDSGMKTYTQNLTATELSKVTKAKVLVFDCGNATEPSMFNTNMIVIAKDTVNK